MLAGCAEAPPAAVPPPPVVYEAGLAPWPPRPASATIGRGVAPARAVPVAITAATTMAPMVPWRVYAVPGAEARAAVSGTVGDAIVVEVIGVDDGVIRWRDTAGCQAPVVHVTAGVVVCADATRLAALAVDTGAVVWRHDGVFAGADGGWIVARAGERVLVIAADDGAIVADAAPPPGVLVADVQRACPHDGGVELWAWGAAGALQRFVVGEPAIEAIILGRAPAKVDLCAAPALVELPIPGSSERELSVVARAPLRIAAGPVVERGFWRAGAEVVTATALGIEVRDAAMTVVRRTSDVEVGRELSARGTRRLVRGAAGLPVLLDGDRPIATLSAPSYVDSAVLGDTHVVGGPWQAPARSLADRLQRFRLPDGTTGVAPLFPPAPARPPAHALDLPIEGPAPLDELTRADAGAYDVGLIFVDPDDPAIVYAAPLEGRPDAQGGAGLAALDLRARAWTWYTPDGCPAGTPVAVAVAADVIACGSRTSIGGSGAVRAVARDGGAVRWTWTGATVDAVVAAGGLVVVTVGRRAVVLDAATGAALAEVASDDGFVPRLVAARWHGHDAVFTAERGAIVARLPRIGMLPVWSVAVVGAVVGLARVGAQLTAQLAGDELYLLELDTGAAVAASGWGRRWRTVGVDLVVVEDADLDDWRLDGYGVDGAPRFAVSLALAPPRQLGVRGTDADAAVPVAYGPASSAAVLLDPRTGVVARRVTLPERAVTGAVFATVVDGERVAGAVLARPLAAVLF